MLIITGGGPVNSTQTPGLYLYQSAFTYAKFGYATAVGTVLMLITLTFSFCHAACSLPEGYRCRDLMLSHPLLAYHLPSHAPLTRLASRLAAELGFGLSRLL